MLKTASFAFALSLLLLAPDAGAFAPHGSFSHGFSSHASSHASSSHASMPHAAPAPSAPRSGFGSFGSRAAAPKQSDSASSQQLSRNAAQANALRTLDERNAAKAAQASRSAPPATDFGRTPSIPAQPINVPPQQAPAPAPTTVIVHRDGGGLGHVLAGAMIARSASAHAHGGGYYAGPVDNPGMANAGSHGGSLFGTLLSLCLLALVVWGVWVLIKRIRIRRAALAEADKPNYSFERN